MAPIRKKSCLNCKFMDFKTSKIAKQRVVKILTSAVLLTTSLNSIAQISDRILMDKSTVGLSENLLYAWVQTYPGEQRIDLWFMFSYTDLLRPPTLQDSVLISTKRGQQIKLGNKVLNGIRPITVYNTPGLSMAAQKTVRFESVYRFELPPALCSMLKDDFIKGMQLEIAPLANGMDWARKFDITAEANLKRALKQEHEALRFGNSKLGQKEVLALMMFFEDR